MIDYLTKSVKSVYGSMSNSGNNANLEFIKIDTLHYKNSIYSSIIALIEGRINIYILQNDPLDYILLSSIKTYYNEIVDISSINYIQNKEIKDNSPCIALTYNSNKYNENKIEFINIFTNKSIKYINKKYKIIQVIFNNKYISVSCNHGKIYVHDNNNLSIIYKVGYNEIKNLKNYPKLTSKKEEIIPKTQKYYYNVIFDLTEDSLLYFMYRNTELEKEKEENYTNNKNNKNIGLLETLASTTTDGISRLTQWTFNTIDNLNQLRKSVNAKSNITTQLSTSSTLSISILSLENNNLDHLTLPYFNKRISYLKQINTYIIVGNKEGQIFYIFDIYSQTNKKFKTSNQIDYLEYKLIYSFLHGYTSSLISCLSISNNLTYLILTSKKGTTHIYILPQRDNQVSDIFELGKNTRKFSGDNDQDKNMEIINAPEIFKIDCNGGSIFYSSFLNINNIHFENSNIEQEGSSKIKLLFNDKYMNSIKNGNYIMILNDIILSIYYIFDEKNIILIKKLTLKTVLDENALIKNHEKLDKNCFYKLNTNDECKNENNKNINDIYIDSNTTNLSYFGAYQNNTLFRFNKKVGNINDNIKDEISLYEDILNEEEQYIVNCFNDCKERKIKIKNLYMDNQDYENVNNNIINALNSTID